MASSTQSIREDDEDAPQIFKRRRPLESGSQSQRPVQRFRSRILEDEEEDEELIRVDHDIINLEESDTSQQSDQLIPIELVDSDNSEHSEQDDNDNYDNEDELELIPNIVTTNNSSLFNNNLNGAPLRLMLTDPEVLECPICVDQLFTPVFQCENGHIACTSCCIKMKRKCPFCCMPIGYNYNRCRGIERFIESISKISCKNAKLGCKKMIPYGKKSEHEQMCAHATCNCPYPSCHFVDCSKNLYNHFGINHATFTTQFTYSKTFSVDVDICQSHIFLQEEKESVIFIVNHKVHEDGRAFNVDCVGPGSLKKSFRYELTAKSIETSLSLQSVPKVYTEWSTSSTSLKNRLTVPFEYADYYEILSLSVCIEKVDSSEFEVGTEEEVEEDEEVNYVNGAQVVMTNFNVLVCSICFKTLCTRVFQCEKGHLACSSCCSKPKQICLLDLSKELYHRCRGLEKVIESVRISCKNAKDGCEEIIPYSRKRKHEQMCPYSTCFCPHPSCDSCPFSGSYKKVYNHFDIEHAASATRFTYNTTFSLCIDINRNHVFLQEQHEGAIFILNQEVKEHGRAFNVEYVGSSTFKKCLTYQLTAKSMETCYLLESKPDMHIKCPKHASKKNYLRVPFEFAGDKGLLSLSVSVTKA